MKGSNAQVYDKPMHKSVVFRMTIAQWKAFKAQCKALKVKPSQVMREKALAFAGVKP